MVVTCVHIRVKPEALKEFTDATVINHRETRKEPGNIRFDFLRTADDPHSFMLYEVFRSEGAVADHKETSHYIAWRDRVRDMMAETRYGVRYDVIEPSEVTKW